ncbi:hypothetical protein RI367_004705 [Sorochytrium milnesiophthora]
MNVIQTQALYDVLLILCWIGSTVMATAVLDHGAKISMLAILSPLMAYSALGCIRKRGFLLSAANFATCLLIGLAAGGKLDMVWVAVPWGISRIAKFGVGVGRVDVILAIEGSLLLVKLAGYLDFIDVQILCIPIYLALLYLVRIPLYLANYSAACILLNLVIFGLPFATLQLLLAALPLQDGHFTWATTSAAVMFAPFWASASLLVCIYVCGGAEWLVKYLAALNGTSKRLQKQIDGDTELPVANEPAAAASHIALTPPATHATRASDDLPPPPYKQTADDNV